jgi:hypothetical protein
MPCVLADGDRRKSLMLLRRIEDWVEVAGAVTSEKNRLGVKVLQRNTKRIKFHR